MTAITIQILNRNLHDVANALSEVLEQMNLMKQGKEPSEDFNPNTGICDNLIKVLEKDVLCSTPGFLARSVINAAIGDIVKKHTDVFSSCYVYPIKDPSGELSPDIFYLRSGDKYTPDVIDLRIKLAELIIQFCNDNVDQNV